MEYTFRPIQQWPGQKTRRPKRSRFDSSWKQTLDLLASELAHLGARSVVIQADCPESEIRLDGMLRANARLNGQGVILSFQARKGGLSFPCDSFDQWQDNVRAIALTLEALRKIDRYGVTQNNQQYTGWRKLESEAIGTTGSVDEAMTIISEYACMMRGGIMADQEMYRRAVKKAKNATHPDRHGGDETDFRRLMQAVDLIERVKGWTS